MHARSRSRLSSYFGACFLKHFCSQVLNHSSSCFRSHSLLLSCSHPSSSWLPLSLARFPLSCSFLFGSPSTFLGSSRCSQRRLQDPGKHPTPFPPSFTQSKLFLIWKHMHVHVFLFIRSPSLSSCSWVLLVVFFCLKTHLVYLTDTYRVKTVHHAADTACLISALSFSSTLAFWSIGILFSYTYTHSHTHKHKHAHSHAHIYTCTIYKNTFHIYIYI